MRWAARKSTPFPPSHMPLSVFLCWWALMGSTVAGRVGSADTRLAPKQVAACWRAGGGVAGFTAEQVEEVRMVIRMLPVFLTTILYWTIYAQVLRRCVYFCPHCRRICHV